jgi:hypothetical protein
MPASPSNERGAQSNVANKTMEQYCCSDLKFCFANAPRQVPRQQWGGGPLFGVPKRTKREAKFVCRRGIINFVRRARLDRSESTCNDATNNTTAKVNDAPPHVPERNDEDPYVQ